MLTIQVIFEDGLVSDLQSPEQLKELQERIKDPQYIEQYGHVAIDDVKIGFGIGWVKKTTAFSIFSEIRGV